jgi:hypothetical protein
VNVNRFDPYKSYRFLVYFGIAKVEWTHAAVLV